MNMTPLSRRRLLAATAAAAVGLPAVAQDPKPLTFIVPAPAGGGGLDAVTRLFARQMEDMGSEPIVVENRPGASTNIANEYVARSGPGGRIVLFAGTSMSINEHLFKLNISPLRDLQPVVQLSEQAMVLVVPADSPIRTPADVERAARQKPGGLNCGSPPGPMLLGCMQLATALPATAVPFPGLAPAITAVLGGHLDMVFITPETAVLPYVEAGKLRIIAASDEARANPALRGIPTFRGTWPDMVSHAFLGTWVSAGTPADTVLALNREFNRALARPEVRRAMLATGQQPVGGTPQAFMARARQVQAEYGKVAARLRIIPQ